ncbi:MAG: hypothetical protein ACI802_002299 [Candidatus Paceibacteria bacterium]|jgi:hypothetical protein
MSPVNLALGKNQPMRHFYALLVAAVLMGTGPVFAQWIDREGRRLPDTDRMKTNGDLGIQIVLTSSASKFRDTWNKSATPPRLESSDSVRRGGEISAMIVFHGCSAGTSGTCNALVRFSLVSPDGTITPGGEGPLWTGRPIRGQILLSNATMTVGFDKTDKAGKYKILAIVIDKEAGKQLQVSVPFTLL